MAEQLPSFEKFPPEKVAWLASALTILASGLAAKLGVDTVPVTGGHDEVAAWIREVSQRIGDALASREMALAVAQKYRDGFIHGEAIQFTQPEADWIMANLRIDRRTLSELPAISKEKA